MKPIVELISEWDAYANQNSKATVESFCKFYLQKTKVKETEPLFGGMMPPDLNSVMAKLIGRLASIHGIYCKLALKEVKHFEFEWFYFLNVLFQKKEAKKTEVINLNNYEQSTGNDILNRIKKQGYICERNDPNDKRAKLVRLTPSGEKLLFHLYDLLQTPTNFIYKEIPEEDKDLIVTLLTHTEIKHSKILAANRNKSLEEIIEAVERSGKS